MKKKRCNVALANLKDDTKKLSAEEERLEVHAVQSEEEANKLRKKFNECKESINLVLIKCY